MITEGHICWERTAYSTTHFNDLSLCARLCLKLYVLCQWVLCMKIFENRSLGGSRLSVSCTIQQIIEQTLATNFLPMAPSVCLLLCNLNGGNINTGLPPVLYVTQLQKKKPCFFAREYKRGQEAFCLNLQAFFIPLSLPHITTHQCQDKKNTQWQDANTTTTTTTMWWWLVLHCPGHIMSKLMLFNRKLFFSKGHLKVLTLGVFLLILIIYIPLTDTATMWSI